MIDSHRDDESKYCYEKENKQVGNKKRKLEIVSHFESSWNTYK